MGPGPRSPDRQPTRLDRPGDRALEAAVDIEPLWLRRLFHLPADLSGLSRRSEAARLCRSGAGARIALAEHGRRLLRPFPAADQSRAGALCAGAGEPAAAEC